MFEKIKEIRRNMILLSVFYLCLGLLLVMYPDTSGLIICYIVAGFALLYGIVHIVMHFMFHIPFEFKLDLIQGIVGVCAGLYIYLNPEFIMTVLPIILGIIVILDSLMKIQSSVDLKKIGYEQWWYLLIASCVAMLIGFLMIFYPFSSLMTIITFVGIGLIVNGVYDLVHIFILSSKIKYYKQKIDDLVIDEEEIQ